MKTAFITGITGQDGFYLTEFLLKKDYVVHGLIRRNSHNNYGRIAKLLNKGDLPANNLHLHYGDLADFGTIMRLIETVKPNEIYNLAAQSHVGVSFEVPEYTSDISGLGTLRILESIRLLGLKDSCRFYQASTSELYGKVRCVPQNEETPFHPRSPYAVAKLYSYWITVNYREAYGIYACNGILFNHESPYRGEEFVTRKITRALSRVKLGLQPLLEIGNLDALRDWGHAKDYVEMQWLMLQQESSQDYVISTGRQHSVRQFIETACRFLDMKINWVGEGINEYGTDQAGNCIVKVNPIYFRPSEVSTLLGDSSKAKALLGWEPKISFDSLVEEMIKHDISLAYSELNGK